MHTIIQDNQLLMAMGLPQGQQVMQILYQRLGIPQGGLKPRCQK